MGSSGDVKGIDASVGGLVWVRRRNGSWWPGKILGLDELSESCLVSPRSGTPVKLLGREDASIDWYNLEKSKRVKAFRCGEYDECIEKAKASAANSCKKAVKYARREDAILHALELENAHLGKDQLDFSYRTPKNASDGEHGASASESPPVSDSSEEGGGAMSDDVSKSEETCQKKGNSEVSSDSAPEFSLSDIHLEEPNNAGSSKGLSGQNRRRTPNDSEDDGTEGVKRMRGLEDLGVCLLANRKSHSGEQLEVVQQEDSSLCEPNPRNSSTNGNHPNRNMYSSALRRKRSQVASVQEFLKRKNRRRPLTKVLKSTTMVSVPVICDQLPSARNSPLWGMSDGRHLGLETESKKSNSLAAINSSDGAAVSCDDEASLNASEGSRINCKVKENEVGSCISRFPENNSSDKLFDVPFIGEEKHSPGFSPTNLSSSSGRSPVSALGRQTNRSTPAIALGNEVIGEPDYTNLTAAPSDNMNQRIERGTSKWQLKGKRNSRHLSNYRKQDSRKYLDADYASSYGCNLLAKSKKLAEGPVDGLCDWGKRTYGKPNKNEQKTEVEPQKLLPYRHSRFAVHSRYQMPEFSARNYISDSRLYDVKLEVKASYRPQHVPLVSLMSKLNGKAIVGHPLTIEIVDEGFCDSLLSRIESDLEADENGYAVKNTAPTRIQAKQLQPSFSPNKSPKTKKSGQLCKKIRKLSSLTGHNRHQNELKEMVQKSNDHVITCIPLKVVFSRINEAVSGLSRPSHHALTKAVT